MTSPQPKTPDGKALDRKTLELCSYCAKLCRHTCPLSNSLGRETLIPQAKMHLLDLLERNSIGWTPEHAAPLFACTGCGACQQVCKHHNDVAAALFAGRAAAVERGVAPPEITEYPGTFRRRSDYLANRLREQALPDWTNPSARTVYLPGCDTIASAPGDIAHAFTLFGALGLLVTLPDAPIVCAGYPLWAAGTRDAALLTASRVVQHIRQYDQVVLGCAACTYTLRHTLPAEGLVFNTRVLHLSEFLAENVDRLPVRRKRRAAYYHDPCYLGRKLGCYEAPRELLARCVESPREFFHHHEHAECCGGGGLVPLTHGEATEVQARRRLAEPELYGVDLVVTACSGCKRSLRKGGTAVEVLDLVNLLAWGIGVDS